MKQKTSTSIFLTLFMAVIIFSCNSENKSDESVAPEAQTASMPAYDPEMDPIKVEAKFIKLLSDTLNVKLYEFAFNPGDSVEIHTHPDNVIYVLEGGTINIKPKDGEEQAVEFKTGTGFVSGSGTHWGWNSGKTTVRLLVADIYRPRN